MRAPVCVRVMEQKGTVDSLITSLSLIKDILTCSAGVCVCVSGGGPLFRRLHRALPEALLLPGRQQVVQRKPAGRSQAPEALAFM